MTRPLNRVIPHPGESLYSLLHRLAKANYHSKVAYLLKDSHKFRAYVRNNNYFRMETHEEVDRIVKSLDLMQEELVLNKFNALLFGGEPNRHQYLEHFSNLRTKYCPLCMETEFFHRLIWDVNIVTICPNHGVMLVDRCDRCKKNITLPKLLSGTCNCGYHYMNTTNLINPGDLVLDAQLMIQDLLQNKRTSTFIENRIQLSSRDYFVFLELFSSMIDHFPGGHPVFSELPFKVQKINFRMKRNNTVRDVVMLSIVTAIAHQLIVNPRKYFTQILDVVEGSAGRGRVAYNRRLRNILREVLNHKQGEIYLDVYQKYLETIKTYYVKQTYIVKPKIENKEYMTIRETMKMLGISICTVYKFCDRGYLKFHITERKNDTVMLIERNSVNSVLQILNMRITVQATTRALGCSTHLTKKLLDNGILQGKFVIDLKSQIETLVVEKSSLDELVKNIFAEERIVDDLPSGWISFNHAINQLKHVMVDGAELLEMIKDRRLNWYILRNQVNLKGLFLSENELRSLIQQLEIQKQENYGLTTSEAARNLRVAYRTLLRWIEEGRVNTTQTLTPTGNVFKRFITIDELDRIRKVISNEKS